MKLTAATLLLSLALPLTASAADTPNIVLLLADDMGWTGSSVQMDDRVAGSKSDLYRTPSLERMASQGMRFSNAYSPAPNCSPTRMAIQTGKTAARLGATDIIDVVPDENGKALIQPFHDLMYFNKPLLVPFPIDDLPEAELTIAEYLKRHEPKTVTGHFGKWHMGVTAPERHGYDEHNGSTTNTPGGKGVPDPKRTAEITKDSIAFLDKHGPSGRPFYLQVSYYAVHIPVRAFPENVERYKTYPAGTNHPNEAYAAMTEEMDESVGQILAKLDELGLSDNTYVIFTSDNGGESDTPLTSNVPLSMGKTHVWEGGIRVPMIVRGPGIAAGSQTHVPAIGYDFLPTIAEWIGEGDDLPSDIDGGSLAGVLAGRSSTVVRGTEELIWYYGAYRNMKHVAPQTAIRSGQHKLIRELDSGREYLYDLDLDLRETTDLSSWRPEIAKKLSQRLDAYFEEVDLELPTRNPDYDPAKDPGLPMVNLFGPR